MGTEHPKLSTLDFLLDITQNSLSFYSENTIEAEGSKCSFELSLSSNDFNALEEKLENALKEFDGNSVITSYIEFRLNELKRFKNNNTISAYQNNPGYGIQYFSLIRELLQDKKKQIENLSAKILA